MIDPNKFLAAFPDTLHLRAFTPIEIAAGGYDRQQYVVEQPFRFNGPFGPFAIPAGFQTDFASIPKAAWWWMDPEDPVILYPSIAHDYGYSTLGHVSPTLALTREQIDQGFAWAMGICGARLDQQKIVLGAVRAFGASHWVDKPLAA